MQLALPARIPPEARSVTLDEWSRLPEDEPAEWVDGWLVESEVPDWVHETIVVWLVAQIKGWARAHEARVAASGVRYAVTATRGRAPDLSVFLDGRRPPPKGLVRIPADVMIEVISDASSDVRRDRVEKLSEYAQFGVRWYWLVDPQLRTLEILELRAGVYAHVGAAASGLVEAIPGFPDLSLDLDALWADVDAL
ncbi:MAG: Uma2 family endonuclease [Myxococcota bacterium]